MSRTEKDYCSAEGAAELKAQIEHYWRERGYEVRVDLVQAGFEAVMRSCRHDMRSDLVNGWPTRTREEARANAERSFAAREDSVRMKAESSAGPGL